MGDILHFYPLRWRFRSEVCNYWTCREADADAKVEEFATIGLVRKFDTRTAGNSDVTAVRARVLHLGGGGDNDDGKTDFVREPGIAQSVHWFRDQDSGLTEDLMASLISSELQVPFWTIILS